MKYFKTLIFIPSFYGAFFFSLFFLFYYLRVIEFDLPGESSLYIFGFTSFLFVISTFLYFRRFKKTLSSPISNLSFKIGNVSKAKFIGLVLFFISLIGIVLYLKGAADYFGGISNYFVILISDDAWQIRSEGDQFSSSVGIQLTYFGWISSSLFLNLILQKKISKKWIALIVINVLLNMLFLDRTRPSWILFTLAISVLHIYYSKLSSKKIFIIGVVFPSIFIFLFISIGSFLGKVSTERLQRGWDIPPQLQSVINYGVSPFAYFDRMLIEEDPKELVLDRTIYPLRKILADIGLVDPPSPLVNKYYFVPSETNVGTFLEPFYRDGGIPYTFIGMIIHAFFLNELALFFLRNRNIIAYYAYANLCFVNLMSFFTPKLNNFPIWLFILLGIFSIWNSKVKIK